MKSLLHTAVPVFDVALRVIFALALPPCHAAVSTCALQPCMADRLSADVRASMTASCVEHTGDPVAGRGPGRLLAHVQEICAYSR